MKSQKRLLLILASICFVIIIGAAIYEHVVLVPKWSAAPPSSLEIFQGKYKIEPQYFWIPIHPITLLLMISALIANWRNARRKDILVALIGYVLMLVATFSYFVPTLISIMKTPYQDTVDPVLINTSSTWETLSLIRLAILIILSI